MTHSQSPVFIFCCFFFSPLSSSFSAELAPPPRVEQQGCFHSNAEAIDWQSMVSVVLLQNLRKSPHFIVLNIEHFPSQVEVRVALRWNAALLICWHSSNETRKTAEPFPQTQRKSSSYLPRVYFLCFFPIMFSQRGLKVNVFVPHCCENTVYSAGHDSIT